MSYASAYKRNERREQLNKGGLDIVRQLFWAVGITAVTVAARYGLYVVNDQLGNDVVPLYITNSYFGVLYLYTALALIGITIQFATHSRLFAFNELYDNRCHLLERMGIAASGVSSAKITATLAASAFIYTLGFALTFLFCYVIGLNFVMNFLVSLFFVGLMAVQMIVLVGMMISVLIKPGKITLAIVLLSALISAGLLFVYGYFDYLDGKNLALKVSNMMVLQPAAYLAVFTLVGILSYTICILVSAARAGSYNPKVFDPDALSGDYMPDDVLETRSVPLLAVEPARPLPNAPHNTQSINKPAPPAQGPSAGQMPAAPQAPQGFDFFNTGAESKPAAPAHTGEAQPNVQPNVQPHVQLHQPPHQQFPQQGPAPHMMQRPLVGGQHPAQNMQPPAQRSEPAHMQEPHDYEAESLDGFGGAELEGGGAVVKRSIAKLIFGIIFGLLGVAVAGLTVLGKTADLATETNEIIRFVGGYVAEGTGFLLAIGVGVILLAIAALLIIMSGGKVVEPDEDEDYDEDDEDYED